MTEDNDIVKIIQSRKKRKQVGIRKALIASNRMQDKTEIILNVDNMDLKIIDNKLQVRAREEIATLKPEIGISDGENAVKLTSAFTTTSNDWIDVAGLSNKQLISVLGKKDSSRLKRILPYLKRNTKFLKQIIDRFPYEVEHIDVYFGIFKVRLRPKRK